MATTQCLRVAQWLPTFDPAVGDGVQCTQVTPLRARFAEISAGNALPVPTKEGDVMQADAALQWVAVQIDGGATEATP